MEQVIGFLILIALIVFFLPVSQNTKIKRLHQEYINNSVIRVEKCLDSNWYNNIYVVRTIYGRYKIKTFICFGYTDVKEHYKI